MKNIVRKLVIGLFSIAWPFASMAGDAEKGAEFFKNINGGHCVSCHYTDGRKMVGPGLKNVTQRHSDEWLHKFLSNPQATWKGDDAETMELKKRVRKTRSPVTSCRKNPMSDGELNDLLAYLKSLEE